MNKQTRTYHIISTNCDCSSDMMARTSINWMWGPRCPGCYKILGAMQYDRLGTIRANGELDALQKWRKKTD